MAYIRLFANEFSSDAWEEYCNICGVHKSATSITIDFDEDDVIAEYNEDEEEEYVPSAENGDYSPSNPWDAPGMSIHDFI